MVGLHHQQAPVHLVWKEGHTAAASFDDTVLQLVQSLFQFLQHPSLGGGPTARAWREVLASPAYGAAVGALYRSVQLYCLAHSKLSQQARDEQHATEESAAVDWEGPSANAPFKLTGPDRSPEAKLEVMDADWASGWDSDLDADDPDTTARVEELLAEWDPSPEDPIEDDPVLRAILREVRTRGQQQQQ